jgi:hypothetical protein
MGRINTRLWKGSGLYKTDWRFLKRIFPYIMVQNIPYDVISEFFQPGARINNSNEDTAVGSGVIDQEWLNSIDVFVQSDASGIFAVRKLTGIMSMIAGSNDIGYQIRTYKRMDLYYISNWYTHYTTSLSMM